MIAHIVIANQQGDGGGGSDGDRHHGMTDVSHAVLCRPVERRCYRGAHGGREWAHIVGIAFEQLSLQASAELGRGAGRLLKRFMQRCCQVQQGIARLTL